MFLSRPDPMSIRALTFRYDQMVITILSNVYAGTLSGARKRTPLL
jgi:hypothetical protein